MDGTVAQNPETAFSGAIKMDEAEVVAPVRDGA